MTLKETAKNIDVNLIDIQAIYDIEKAGEILCMIRPVVSKIIEFAKEFTPEKIDKIIDETLNLYEKLCDGEWNREDLIALVRTFCAIYSAIKGYLHEISIQPTRVGYFVKVFMKIMDFLCREFEYED